jgi:hypothetical protein
VVDSQDEGAQPGSATAWKSRIARCKQYRDHQLVPDWAENVDYRRGKPFSADSDENRVNVNLDWTLTKNKHAQLFSQVPEIYLTPRAKRSEPAVPIFQKELNAALTRAKMGTAVDEAVVDAINASGVGVVLVRYRATTEMGEVPVVDPATLPPDQQAAVLSGQLVIPTESVPHPVDRRFDTVRLSPSDLLWPLDFARSDFDEADWLGYSGRMFWPEAQREFKLTDEDKVKVLGSGSARENLRQDSQTDAHVESQVHFDEVYYKAYRFDGDEKYFDCIRRIVFVEGLDKAVLDEKWAGQAFDKQTGQYVGALKYPVRVLTLTYLSDDCIPPSDTAIGRPQIRELVKSRTQIIDQRERSKPVRWMDVNRVDPMVMDTLMRGTYQAFVPVNGDGSRAVGEVARAAYPREDFEFDRIVKGDLNEQWQLGPSNVYAAGRSATEARDTQQNFQTRVGVERAKVAEFIVGIAEVLAGLLALYGEFSHLDETEQQRMQSWDRRSMAGEFVYYIRPDATVLLDAQGRVARLMKYLNVVGKSGYVDPKPIIAEITMLNGLDPATVMRDPEPAAPDAPNISFRFNAVDLVNPIALAMLVKSGQAPNPDDLAAAVKMLQAAHQAAGPQSMIPPTTAEEAAVRLAPGVPTTPVEPPVVAGQPPAPGTDMQPGWTPMPRVSKRIDEPGG